MDRSLLERAVAPLLEWYRLNKRELPWRGTRDPYRVLVSEIMLQQTRVEAVKGYYTLFLEQFPTAAALAAASSDEVMKAWQGLGYYSRARNLQNAAKIIAAEGFPSTFEGVRALPGVGDYTAGAVCSIAYNLPCPAVDGNVLRILTRLYADGSDPDGPAARASFSALLKEVYPPEAGDFCQALMELGAIVCLPNGAPLCGSCPWQSFCRVHLAGEEEKYPVRPPKKARKRVELKVFVLKCGDEYALNKRGKGLLAGLWEFPNFEGEAPDFGKILAKKRAKYIFTHVEWQMTGYLTEAKEKFPQYVWATAEEIEKNYAIPSAFKAFSEWVK